MNYITKVSLTHGCMAFAYTGLVSYHFVTSLQPDPIGTGLGLLSFMAVHLILTVVAAYFFTKKLKVEERKFKINTNLIVVTLVLVLTFLLNNSLASWLWDLR